MFRRSLSASCRCTVALAGLLSILALAPMPALADGHLAIGSAASVTTGEPLLLRTTPGFDAEASTEVASGTQVTILDGPVTAADGSLWYQVDVWGQVGYLPSYALSSGATPATDPALEGSQPVTDAALTTDPAVTDPAAAESGSTDPAASGGPGTPIGIAYIAGTDGDGAVCHAAADYGAPQIAVLPEGSAVEVIGATVGEWQPVNCNGTAGYVHASFISWDAAEAWGTEASTDAATLEEQWTDPSLTAPADTTTTDPALEASAAQPAGRRGSRGGGGQAIADFALQYNGYPYVYAGEGPYAFDCSGFTKFVILNTLGIDITHDMFVQATMGTPVGQGELQPGDLVFFQNTFRAGLSHAGIYIGGGQFIHAENESTGVRVSDINSDYYASRWYGAIRLW